MARDPETLVGRRVQVEVPATIANLGAGYDCLGLAIEMPLVVAVEARPAGTVGGPDRVELAVTGEGEGELGARAGNRFVEGLEAGLTELGFADLGGIGWAIEMANPIPLARGLGSSGAATVAGLLAAEGLAGSALGPRLLQLATRIEGHPDNVAPALLGGFVAALAIEDRVEAFRFDVPSDLRIVLFIPELRLPTAGMRAVLPELVPRADAVANLGRVAVAVAGIASGRWDALGFLAGDRLHEPYRAAAYAQLPSLIAAAREAGAVGACLAGAGSSIAAFCTADLEEAVGNALAAAAAGGSLPGRALVVSPRNAGTRTLEVR